MKTRTAVVAAFSASSALGAVLLRSLLPQVAEARTKESCPWPPELDAVAAAPGNHRVVLENDRVRVLDVTVAPGTREPLHAHCLPSVLVVLEGGRARDYDGHAA